VARKPESATRSIAARLALLFGLVAFVSLSVVGISLQWVLRHEMARHQAEQIQGRTEDLRYMLNHGRPDGLAARAMAKIEALSPADERNRYWMWSPDPAYLYGQDLQQALDATRGKTGVVDLYVRGRHMKLQAVDLPAQGGRPELRLIVGVDVAPFAQTLRSFRWALMVVTLLGALVLAALGYWVARMGLMPVRRMSEEAHRIEPGNRAQRLDVSALPHELSDLGGSLNAALERLDSAYHQLAAFNDNVAHELRTPLANLIGQTQVALSRERDGVHLREVLQSNLEELERLRSIVADMLFLARAEQGARAQDLVQVSLAAEVAKTLEFMDLLLEEGGMQVQVQGDAQALVQTALFRRALINLLHNAIQHSAAGSQIMVQIETGAQHASVAILNPGPVIPAEHLPRLFDRFYRIEKSRANSGESHGLGLAIVKAVALMHEGQVFASSSQGQTRVGFQVRLAMAALPKG